MLNALKDYRNMCLTPQFAWIRKHWKGYTVFTAACFAVPLAVLKAYEVKDKIEEKRNSTKEES